MPPPEPETSVLLNVRLSRKSSVNISTFDLESDDLELWRNYPHPAASRVCGMLIDGIAYSLTDGRRMHKAAAAVNARVGPAIVPTLLYQRVWWVWDRWADWWEGRTWVAEETLFALRMRKVVHRAVLNV